jgi:hypothetical protein
VCIETAQEAEIFFKSEVCAHRNYGVYCIFRAYNPIIIFNSLLTLYSQHSKQLDGDRTHRFHLAARFLCNSDCAAWQVGGEGAESQAEFTRGSAIGR